MFTLSLLEIIIRIDRALLAGQSPDVSVGCEDLVALAQELFDGVLKEMDQGGGLGIKYEAACRYNLGQALMQQGKEPEAVPQFNETMIIFPNSIYSKAANRVLEQRRSRGKSKDEEQPEDQDDQLS